MPNGISARLKELEKRTPELTKRRKPIAPRRTLTPEEIGFDVPEGWSVNVRPPAIEGRETRVRVVNPAGQEFLTNQISITGTGQWLTPQEAFGLKREPERFEISRERRAEAIRAIHPQLFPEITGLEEFTPDVAAIEDWIDRNPEAFLERLLDAGRTPETEEMLRTLGATNEEIDELLPIKVPFEKQPEAVLRLEPEWENTRTGEVITESEKATRFPKGWEPELDEWTLTPETARNYVGVFEVFGKSLTKLPKQTGAAILKAIQGHQGASVVDPGWSDRWIENAQTDLEQFATDVRDKYGNVRLPINVNDLATLPESMGFSFVSMGAGLGVGVPIALTPVPGARVGAWIAGTAASGAAAFNMASYQIMQLYLETKDEEMKASQGRGITLAEEEALKKDFSTQAIKYGLWEAVPEALSNLAFAKLLTLPLGRMVGKSITAKMLAKLTGIYGEEFLTETITQKGQSAIEVDAGLREGKITWIEAFKEIAPQTFLLTTILGGLGSVGIASVNRIKRSLKKEAGDSPAIDTILENIDENLFNEVEAESTTLDVKKTATDFLKRLHKEERGAIGRPEEGAEVTPFEQTILQSDKGDVSVSKLAKMIERAKTNSQKDALFFSVFGEDRTTLTQHMILSMPSGKYLLKREGRAAPSLTRRIIDKYGVNAGTNDLKKIISGLAVTHPDRVSANFTLGLDELTLKPTAKAPAVEAVGEDTLPLEEISKLETRIPLDLIRKDEPKSLAKLTEEIKETGITEPIVIRVREDGSRIVWDGIHRLIVAQDLGIENVPVKYIGEKGETLAPPAIIPPPIKPVPPAVEAVKPPPKKAVKKVKPPTAKELETELTAKVLDKPIAPQTSLTTKEVAENWAIVGKPKYNMKQIDALVGFFADYLNDPTTLSAYELTRELRRETRAGRVKNLNAMAQQLVAKEGLSTEEALNQAIRETMSGELPSTKTEYLEGLTNDLRDALYAKVYHVLKAEGYEWMSTITALTNALDGKQIPREPGVRGGSAYSRLLRVFGDQPKVMKAIDDMAKAKKPLKDVVEGLYMEVGKPPLPIDEDMAEWLRNLQNFPHGQQVLYGKPTDLTVSDLRTPLELEYAKRKLDLDTQLLEGKITKDAYDIEVAIALEKAHPPTPVTQYDAPIDKVFKIKPLFSFMEQSTFNRVLKELLWSPLDIGNFLRANKASFDNSFLRQSKALAGGHPIAGWQAHMTAWQSMFSQKHTEAEWQLITQDPAFQIYEQIRVDTGHDPLRVPAFAAVKGTEQYRTSEEFGFTRQDVTRAIPKFTSWLPHVKYSERAFSAGTNKIVWEVWKQKLEWSRRYAEKIASGEIKLKEGEAFDIVQEMTAHQAMLGNMIQRANLRRFSGLAPAMNALFFAARSKIGRFLAPTHLIGITLKNGKVNYNPRIIKEAWRDFLLTNAEIGGLMFLGSWLGLWDLEDDPRNAEFMSARIGNTRIDPWAGQRQFVVLYSRLVTKTGISSVTGAEYDVNPQSAFLSFITNSLSPLASAMKEFYTGRNFIGGLIDFTDAEYWIEKILPFAIDDVWEAAKEDWRMGIAVTIPAIYGEGVQTYTGEWVEDFPKLGLPKYLENTAYGVKEPVYDIKGFWSDYSSKFAGVDPETLTESKGFPPYIKAMAEARVVNEQLKILSSEKLYLMNADPAEGTTFAQYYEMWRDREEIVLSGDEDKLKKFDADDRTKNAHLGNFSQRQFALLNEYHGIIDIEAQKAFLENHKDEIGIATKTDWLRENWKENGLLAAFGQEDAYTKEAYDEARRIIEDLDFPDSAVEEYLPPEHIAETHFKYLESGEEFGWSSHEVKLLLQEDAKAAREAKTTSYVDWRTKTGDPLTLSTTPTRALELKIKHSETFALDKELTDEELRVEVGAEEYQSWVDDKRRIEAIEHRAISIGEPVDEGVKVGGIDIVEKWVERGRTIDEFGAGSTQDMAWLINNGQVWDWAVREGLLKDDGADWNFPAILLDDKWHDLDSKYGVDIPEQWKHIVNPDERASKIAQSREDLYFNNKEYYESVYERKALRFSSGEPEFKKFPEEQIPLFIEWNTDGTLKKPEGQEDNIGWYEDDWFLQDNPTFHDAMVDLGIWKEHRDLRGVPTREVFAAWVGYWNLPEGQARLDYRAQNNAFNDWMVNFKGYSSLEGRGKKEADLSDLQELTKQSLETSKRLRELKERALGLK